MAEYPVRRPVQSLPIHPGEVLREDVLLALRLSVTAAAKQLGVPRQTLHRILAERVSRGTQFSPVEGIENSPPRGSR